MAESMIEVNKLSKLYLSGALFKKSKPLLRYIIGLFTIYSRYSAISAFTTYNGCISKA